ncbi:MAG: hypothetical protein ACPGLY_07805 [Rubripirellula sp.]
MMTAIANAAGNYHDVQGQVRIEAKPLRISAASFPQRLLLVKKVFGSK